MQRRDVLKVGALAAVSGSSCAALLDNPGAVGSGELADFLSALDTAMAKVGGGDFLQRLLGETEDPEVKARAQAAEALAKKTMRSLLMVGTLSELPPEQLAHEAVQKRLAGSMGEFDDAMFGMASTLENLTPTERREISKRLRDDPNLGMRVMGAVDGEAATFGVSLKQRARLRGVSAHCTSRLRLSTDLAATEYVEKMKKIATRQGAVAEAEREVAAAMTTQMLWQRAATGGLGAAEPTPPPPPPPSSEQIPPPPPPPPAEPGDGRPADPVTDERPSFRSPHALITAGGIALGLGLVVFGVGYASGGTAGILLGVTFGVLLGVSGLIVLIVGLIMLAAGK